jgi:uncharacterized protein
MDITNTDSLGTLLGGLAIAVGIFGVIVPALPGLALCWLGVLLWAILADGGSVKWLILAAATVVALTGVVVKYVWAGRHLKRTGVPNTTLFAGGVLGLVGFFVVPVVGLVLGFVLGVWLAERLRFGEPRLAWPSTKQALRAAGLAMLVELGAGLGVAAVWVLGLTLT